MHIKLVGGVLGLEAMSYGVDIEGAIALLDCDVVAVLLSGCTAQRGLEGSGCADYQRYPRVPPYPAVPGLTVGLVVR